MNASQLGKVPGRASVLVRFFVRANGMEAESALAFVEATLDDWAENPASVPLSVYESLNAALAAAGIYVTIVGVSFTAPILGKKVFPATPSEEDDAYDIYLLAVAGGAVLAVIVLILGCVYSGRRKKRREGEGRYLLKPEELEKMTEEQQKDILVEYGLMKPGFQLPFIIASFETQTE